MALEHLTLENPAAPVQPPYLGPDRSNWATKLQDLDLESETLQHYQVVKEYLGQLPTIVFDEKNQPIMGIEPNKVAQVMNTLTSILKDLVKIQVDLHSAEKIKKLESTLIRTLKTLPEDVQNQFFKDYEAALAEI